MLTFLERDRYRNIDANFKLALVRFIFSLGTSSAGIVWGLYMHSLGFSDSAVGFITGIVVLVSLVLSLISTPILEFVRARGLFIFSLLLYTFSYLLVALTHDQMLFVALAFLVAIATVFRVETFAILFRDSVSDDKLSQREGLTFALANFGWFVAPMLAGFLLAHFGFSSVFMFSASTFFIALLMFLLIDGLKVPKHFAQLDGNMFQNIARYIERRELMYPYIVKFGLNVMNGFVLIYIPIFLYERGLKPEYIGALFSIMALFHSIFDFKIGDMVRRYSFKSFFLFGFVTSALLLIAASLFGHSAHMLFFIIFLTGIATLFIEPLQDTFFFTFLHKSEDEERFFPVYGTANQIGNFASKALPAVVLAFLPEQFSYITVALVMLLIAAALIPLKERDRIADSLGRA